MINAKQELLECIGILNIHPHDIDYAYVNFQEPGNGLYTENVDELLEYLDRVYDDDYGTQKLSGTIVFKDGTRVERRKDDGAARWVFRQHPSKEELDSAVEYHNNVVS